MAESITKIEILRGAKHATSSHQGMVLTIGNFDGVHLGHQAVLKQAGAIAKKLGTKLGLLTFYPHPASVLRPDVKLQPLTSVRLKAKLLRLAGVDCICFERFSKETAALTADQFVDSILLQQLKPLHIVAGGDFVFGHQRGGNVEFLRNRLTKAGIGFTAIPTQHPERGEYFSSSLARKALSEANIEAAAAILGYQPMITGRVHHGDGRGASLGFPTANILSHSQQIPKHGVYAITIKIQNSKKDFEGVCHIGARPTFDNQKPTLEAHIFDFSETIYGQRLTVYFDSYIRGIEKFASADQLKQQIHQDIQQAKHALKHDIKNKKYPIAL